LSAISGLLLGYYKKTNEKQDEKSRITKDKNNLMLEGLTLNAVDFNLDSW
jgi:hypothetical protein